MKRYAVLSLLFLPLFAWAEFAGQWDQATMLKKLNDSNVVVIDVRSISEYQEGHIPSAINIPHDKIEDHIKTIKGFTGKEIVLYCRSGRRAGLAERKLNSHGIGNLYHLEGDMQAWKAANLTIEK